MIYLIFHPAILLTLTSGLYGDPTMLNESQIHAFIAREHNGIPGSLICHPPLIRAFQALYQLSDGLTRKYIGDRWKFPSGDGISGDEPKLRGITTLLVRPLQIKDSARQALQNVSQVETMNFMRPGKSVFNINQQVEMATSPRVGRLVKRRNLNTDTHMISLSAGIISGRWQTPFPRENTTLRRFYGHFSKRRQERIVAIPTMRLHGLNCTYARLDDGEMLLLPFAGNQNVKFMILLSSVLFDSKNHKPFLFTMPKYGNLSHLLTLGGPKIVDVQIPKLKFTYSVNLVGNVLRNMGFTSTFRDVANFSRLSSSLPLKLSSMLHSSAIDLDENGLNLEKTHQSPGTAPVLGSAIEVEFIVNRPFFFAVLEHEKVYLTGEFTYP